MDIEIIVRQVLGELFGQGCDVAQVASDLHRIADAVERTAKPARREFATLRTTRPGGEWRWTLTGSGPDVDLGSAMGIPLAVGINAAVALGWTLLTARMSEESDEALLVREAKP